MNPKHIFKRPCEDCDTAYHPTGKYQKYCQECQKKRRDEVTLRLREEKVKND